MLGWLCVILMCVAVLSAPGQTPSSKDQPGTNWSQACGHFSQELQHLSEILALTENQQAEIKPILEQETVKVTEICSNPVFSRVDEVNQYKRLVRASDEKIKPLLSASQLQKLQNLRKEQKQDLEEIIAKQMSTQSSD
jgi:Spy/CpxP family protein refolding chaperone